MTLPFIAFCSGVYPEEAVQIRWHDEPFTPLPAVAAVIAETWAAARRDAAERGQELFAGPMTRLIGWSGTAETITLELGPADYRDFTGTNLLHPELAAAYGAEALANPLGISIAVVTSDGQHVVQQRSAQVFEYPGFFDVCGGNVEPSDVASGSLFVTVRREIEEELGIRPDQIMAITGLGLVANREIFKPDLLVVAEVTQTAADLATRRNSEYSQLMFLPDADGLSRFLADEAEQIAPTGVACLRAVGTYLYGEGWR